jgi:DnaJ family protein A protein 2
VLSDPQKRETYDKYGEEGIKGGGFSESHVSAEDLFANLFGSGFFGGMDDFFGFGFGGRRGQTVRKCDDIRYTLGVTIQELYVGKTKHIQYARRIECTECRGLEI